jgi:predicted AlkP superfamily phosphohydrolase/phosphomutase
MSQTEKTNRLLAIGVDAAEPKLVRQMIEQGQMPALQKLLSAGKYFRVESTAGIGSGSVWPTFISGQDAQAHGAYGEWLWNPETMKLSRYRPYGVKPFWSELAEQGITVGILDVPFMPMVGLREGFEISEWGPHDVVEGKTRVGPDSIGEIVTRNSPHPLEWGIAVSGPHDYQNLEKLGRACLNGIKLRGTLTKDLIAANHPQFLLTVFAEVHRSAHYLWHQAEPDHAVYRNSGIANLTITRPTMHEIYRALDEQVGELISTAGEDTPVMVFSLHGMQATHGAPAFLAPWLCESGFARFGDWGNQSWRDRARALMAKMKKLSPAGLKKLYYRIMPANATHLLALPTMLPLYDWSQTRAFALPTDQHGWIRINLMGRESQGIVPPSQYQNICSDLEERLRDLKSEDGTPLVREIIRTADDVESALAQGIPDIVIHWTDKVFESPLRIKGSAVEVEAVGRKYTGQHALEGFCILRSPVDLGDAEVLSSKEMYRLIRRLLGITDEYPASV